MNVGIGKEAAQLHFWEYINWIFGSVRKIVALYINFAILAVIAAKKFYVTENRSGIFSILLSLI
jgi:hypothetical protein